MFINLEETYQMLYEQEERLKITRDAAGVANKFRTKPQGILIQDTYNNPFLPIRPRPRLDTSKMDLKEVFQRARENYGKFASDFLPWHYVVELVGNRYYVFNTRPIDTKFPIYTNEVLKFEKRKDSWDDVTKMFFKDNIFDIAEAIHICVIGDTNIDIYTKRLYEKLARTCMTPFYRTYKFPKGLFQRTFPLNIGHKFNVDMLVKFNSR